MYNSNETMKKIGKECAMDYLTSEAREEIQNVVDAHTKNKSSLLSLATDIFILGYMYGRKNN